MAARGEFGEFAALEPYRLTGIEVKRRRLGRGSYAAVLELEYKGLKCAGKRIFRILLKVGNQGAEDTAQRFENECHLLSQTRHPNIVQFLGVYFEETQDIEEHDEDGEEHLRVPILVMEFLPTTLANCIDRYGVLPPEISYSILRDVALGLYYLHSHSPPIIHRDLSANNVLLTDSMTAKISDLGVARIINLNPLEITRLTGVPGTPPYMPPETFSANPRYNTSMDVFSFGIMLIHMFSGRWPFPLCDPNLPDPRNPTQLIAVSEADRRNEYLDQIGRGHPLMGLILRCISNNPGLRGTAQEIVQQIEAMVQQFRPTYANRIEMLWQLRSEERKKQSLRTVNKRLVGETGQLAIDKQEEIRRNQAELERRQEERERSELAHSIEVEQLHLQLAESNDQRDTATAQLQAVEEEKEAYLTQNEEMQIQIATKEAEIADLQRQHESEIARKEAEIATKKAQVSSKVAELSAKDRELTAKNATLKRKDSELASKNATLERKSTAIRGLNDQLSRARGYLSSKLQYDLSHLLAEELRFRLPVPIYDLLKGGTETDIPEKPHLFHPQTRLTLKNCANLPMGTAFAQTVVIGDKVYVGGGECDTAAQYYQVFSYSLSEDVWNSLPDCPVRWFGMGQLEGRVVAIGGRRRSDFRTTTNEVYVLDEDSQSWKDSIIPPMTTPRLKPAVLSHHSSLIVAGGYTPSGRTSVVEIFRRDTSQWHRTCPLPFPCSRMSSVVIQNTAYLLGGAVGSDGYSNRVVYASVDSLLQKSLPPDQTSEDSDSVWKTLPNTPHYGSAAATISGCLLAVGGADTSKFGLIPQTEVYIYSPSTASWLHVSDLPSSRHLTTTAMISPTEFLVIGGADSSYTRSHSVFKAEIH